MAPDAHTQLRALLIEAEVAAADLLEILEEEGRQIAIGYAIERLLLRYDPDQPRVERARDYSTIRREHWDSIYGAVVGYLDTLNPITQYRNLAGRAIVEHYPEAFYRSYAAASGSDTVEKEDDEWLTTAIETGVGFVNELFEGLKETRKAVDYDADAIARSHADAYAGTLDSVYTEGALRGKKESDGYVAIGSH